MANAQPTDNNDTLSIPATALYRLGLPVLTGSVYFYSPLAALAIPFTSAPTAALLWQRSKTSSPHRPGNLETLIWTFTASATLAPAACAAVQATLGYGVLKLLFRAQAADYLTELTRPAADVASLPASTIATRNAMAHNPRYIAYLTFFSFALAALPEEGVKYFILRTIERRKGDNKRDENTRNLSARECMLYATTIGLGFAFLESLGAITAESTARGLLVTAAERVLYGTSAHVMTALFTAARMARRERQRTPWYRLLLPSLLYHGTANAALFAASALDGNPGFVHPETAGRFAAYVAVPLMCMTALGLQVGKEVQELGVGWFGV